MGYAYTMFKNNKCHCEERPRRGNLSCIVAQATGDCHAAARNNMYIRLNNLLLY